MHTASADLRDGDVYGVPLLINIFVCLEKTSFARRFFAFEHGTRSLIVSVLNNSRGNWQYKFVLHAACNQVG